VWQACLGQVIADYTRDTKWSGAFWFLHAVAEWSESAFDCLQVMLTTAGPPAYDQQPAYPVGFFCARCLSFCRPRSPSTRHSPTTARPTTSWRPNSWLLWQVKCNFCTNRLCSKWYLYDMISVDSLNASSFVDLCVFRLMIFS
jgi:hypothetical protein